MKNLYQIYTEISLLFYILFLYQTWHICKYGGVRNNLLVFLISVLGFIISFILMLISRKHKKKYVYNLKMKKRVFWIEIIIVIMATIYFGGLIIYSAIPYNGALSWKIDELTHKKQISLVHNNLFEYGADGILIDLDEAFSLPEELFIVDDFYITFNELGVIQTIDTFIYGRDEKGDTKTYQVGYDADKSEKLIVWIDGEANADYDENMRLEPMFRILNEANFKQQVNRWSYKRGAEEYEIVYYGYRTFSLAEGLKYLPGDVDGDGSDDGVRNFDQLSNGGQIAGFEVSLHIPDAEDVIPVRYIMEPDYISQEELNEKQEVEQVETAKEAGNWTIDDSNGTMYFFMDDSIGWRLVVTDAAAGSRFYEMEKTANGGTTWEKIKPRSHIPSYI